MALFFNTTMQTIELPTMLNSIMAPRKMAYTTELIDVDIFQYQNQILSVEQQFSV